MISKTITKEEIPMLTVEHLTKKYGKVTACNDVNLHLDPGSVTVLLGPNGDIAYRRRICDILHDNYLYAFLSRFYPDHTKRLEYFCDFTVSGNLNLALTWLRDGAKEAPEEMAQLAGKIMMHGVSVLE